MNEQDLTKQEFIDLANKMSVYLQKNGLPLMKATCIAATLVTEITPIIKQDQALREIDIRIDELKKFNIYEKSQGRHKCFYDSNNNTVFSINSRIAELQAQKDKLIKGVK